MIEKWIGLMKIILERNLMSDSVWTLIKEVKGKNLKTKKNHEDRILKGIEDLLEYDGRITEEITNLAKKEFKMLFMVATYALTEDDAEGKTHVVTRKKTGFIFNGNDYYVLDYTPITRSPTKAYNKKNQITDYPGANYLISDLQEIKNQFMVSYRGEESEDSHTNH